MRKILSILLSIILFFALSIIIYLFTLKIFIKFDKIASLLHNHNIINYKDLTLKKDSTFINNINVTYQDLKTLGLTKEDIDNIIEKSQVNNIINNIISNKLNTILTGQELTIVYDKEQLDRLLTENIYNESIKDYIIENDYKILNFEKGLNNSLQVTNSKYLSILNILISDRLIIIILSTLIITICLLFIFSKQNFLSYLFTTVLLIGINNIILANVIPYILNINFESTIINYMFKDIWLNYFKYILIISIFLILISIIGLLINERVTKSSNKKNIRPRIRKADRNEEYSSF